MSAWYASSASVPYLLLMASVAALWVSPAAWRPLHRLLPWTIPLLGAIAAGLATGALHPIALASIAALALACVDFTDRTGRDVLRIVDSLAILVLSIGLLAHAAPGFANVKQLSDITLSPDAIAYTQYLNFDKPLIGLFILGITHRLLAARDEWRAVLAHTLPHALLLLIVIITLSLALGFVRWEGDQLWTRLGLFGVWGPVNLLFTCVAEEALFRGFIQRALQGDDAREPEGRRRAIVGLIVSALLFGLAHFAGGPSYVLLSTIAGVGYGWIYWKTGSIEASILTHFLVNTLHFLLFTYPALRA